MSKTLLASAVIVVLYNLLFFHISFGLGTGLIFLILNGYFFLTRENKDPQNLALALLNSALSVLFGFLIAWRDNGFVLLINLLSASFFLFSAGFFYKDKSPFHFSLPSFLTTPFVFALAAIGSLFEARSSGPESAQPHEQTTSSFFIKGLVIALPILAILLLLLTQADPIFQRLTADLFKDIGERLVISVILFVALLLFALAQIKQRSESQESNQLIHQGKAYELSVILGSIALLFGLFIIIQFQYLFSSIGERELAKLGIASLTYSEYVRKGFAELLVVAVISISVLIYALRFVHRLPINQKMLIQLLSSFMTVETGLILLSAAQRDILYASAHGLTRARIFGFIFLVWLAVLLILFLVKIAIDLKRKQFFYPSLGLIVVGLLAFSLINIDGLIAQDFKPTVNGEIDYLYLTSISADAYPVWGETVVHTNNLVASLESSKEVTTDQNRQLYDAAVSLVGLKYRVSFLEDKYAPYEVVVEKYKHQNQEVPNWIRDIRNPQSFNLSQLTAYQYVLQNKELFNQIPKLQDKIIYFQSIYNHTIVPPKPNISSGSANFRPAAR